VQRVTFSRNFTLSLSRTCQCYCKYCAFATHQAHLHAPVDVERILDEAVKRNTKELLVLTGERPEVNPVVAERLKAWGHEDFTSYVVWACERALERGMLPHTNLGVLSKGDLARLREVTEGYGLFRLQKDHERVAVENWSLQEAHGRSYVVLPGNVGVMSNNPALDGIQIRNGFLTIAANQIKTNPGIKHFLRQFLE